jgi:hypothetical protein
MPRSKAGPGALRLAVVASVFLSLGPGRARGQVVVKVNDSVNFRLGTLLQGNADWTQDPISEGYSQNMFLRRIRFILLATIGPTVTAFFQTENARLGNAGTAGTKSLDTGFLVQDAFLEWRVAGEKVMLDAGLLYTPQSRGVLNSSSSTLSFDTPAFGQQQVAVTTSSAGRDTGVGLKGYLLDERLEYRADVFSGQRLAATAAGAGARNSPRAAARVQYDFLDKEKGYTYVGTNRGAKSVLALGAWGDTQGDFKAYGADLMADIPVGKDAVTAEGDYLHYDGGRQFTSVVAGVVTPTLPSQDAIFTHAGFYFDAIKLQPFLRYERLNFREDRFQTRNVQRYGGGVNWYVTGQNLKVTAFYERVDPKVRAANAKIRITSHAGIQLQFYYF